ncbi:MAG TPA: AMP-binding protein, partial [Pseudonocardiaceae bacterium]|nr:AMP-binding protein [Pseudonocardiaceae bacterium]
PKGVMLGRAAAFGNAAKTAALHGFGPDRPHATCLPLFHVNALVMSLLGTKITGAPLVVCERFEPSEYFRLIDQTGARTASIVPALLHRLVEQRPAWPDSLDYLVVAAAPLGGELADRFQQAYGPRLRQGYGLSEAVNFSFTMPLLDSRGFQEHYVANQPPVGVPLPGTEFRLADNEVLIRSPDMMRGYWRAPELTTEAVDTDGWLHTGDLGELRGDYLVLTGRATEVINRGGEKYHPLEIERQWRNAGLTGPLAAVPVSVPELGQDVGLVLDSGSAAAARTLYARHIHPPVAARSGGLAATATGKPRRREMGRGLVARHESVERYEELAAYARASAAAILAGPHRPTTAQSARLYAHARELAAAARPVPVPGRRGVGHDALDVLVDYWPTLADGSGSGPDMMRRHPGLWRRLMVEWPMGSYAELMGEVLTAGDLLVGRVLEVGTGVGNTTRLVADHVRGEFVWSDLIPDLVRRGRWPGQGIVLDFDQPPPPGLAGFDTILATNAVHCAADKVRTLRWLRSMLADGGRLVLAEGANPTTADGSPWALDFWFDAFDGWWDRGGFRTRWEWLSLLEQAGFHHVGYSALRAGRHDLGGVVWGARGDDSA